LNAGQLDRLFLTPDERDKLDEIRYALPVPEYENVVTIEVSNEEYQSDNKEEPINMGRITVNGLVYRKNGKSTGWVNEMSNYEINEEMDNFVIDKNNISPDKLSIDIPKRDMTIELKVGETYLPGIGEITDVLHEEDKAGIEIP